MDVEFHPRSPCLEAFALQIADRESVRIVSAAHRHSFFTDERDSQRRHTVDCRLQVSFPGKRPHLVGAACGQVCGPRYFKFRFAFGSACVDYRLPMSARNRRSAWGSMQ